MGNSRVSQLYNPTTFQLYNYLYFLPVHERGDPARCYFARLHVPDFAQNLRCVFRRVDGLNRERGLVISVNKHRAQKLQRLSKIN